ncbi:hypothetical protein SAMN04488136_13063 [Vibrio xiamenensis]|uniref:Uncharacterized protein n=2 Tax=Vibrio xiamenensis TaxID=861298 RepID=A0A1G8FH29_9VIBR|nr:hypothetical protein SAMN04488136_13063 [Vibrio xiamenensis]
MFLSCFVAISKEEPYLGFFSACFWVLTALFVLKQKIRLTDLHTEYTEKNDRYKTLFLKMAREPQDKSLSKLIRLSRAYVLGAKKFQWASEKIGIIFSLVFSFTLSVFMVFQLGLGNGDISSFVKIFGYLVFASMTASTLLYNIVDIIGVGLSLNRIDGVLGVK